MAYEGNMMTGLTPTPTPETTPFWDAAASGRLSIQRCTSCREHYFYPRPFCPACGSDEVEWTIVSGRARLVSYIVNYLPLPPFDRATPQVIALVALEEGPHLMTNIVGTEPDPGLLELDMLLEVVFVERADYMLPMFQPSLGGAR